jgi:hypothetical protein
MLIIREFPDHLTTDALHSCVIGQLKILTDVALDRPKVSFGLHPCDSPFWVSQMGSIRQIASSKTPHQAQRDILFHYSIIRPSTKFPSTKFFEVPIRELPKKLVKVLFRARERRLFPRSPRNRLFPRVPRAPRSISGTCVCVVHRHCKLLLFSRLCVASRIILFMLRSRYHDANYFERVFT